MTTLNHVEKTFGDAYRKEIDQEENIWRSLPFFAATLAFQLATLFQMIERLPAKGPSYWETRGLLTISSGSTIVALIFLAASIYPSEFRYVAPETEMLDYARGLDEDEAVARKSGDASFCAEDELKKTLAQQYAVAALGNRRVNQRRALWRSIAGLATLSSVLSTITLVVWVVLTYVPKVR